MSIPVTVLILEDSVSDTELMLHELRQSGFEPTWERVETEADFVAHLSPPPDIVLADFKLPQFNGIRALQILRERGLDVPFILVSGSIGEDLAVSVLKAGASDYLLKDRLTRLGQAVSRALEQKKSQEEKRRAEQALIDNEKRFRTLIENSSDTICLIAPVGTFLYVGPSSARIIGYREAELVGRNALEFIHPDDREFIQGTLTGLVRTPGGRTTAQYRFKHKDGSWLWIEGVGCNMLNEPSVQAIVVSYRDISIRKQAEESVKQALAWYEAIFEGSRDAIFISDAESRFIAVNQAACELTGYSKQELLGMRIPDLHEATDLGAYERYHDRIMVGVEIVDEARILRKDGRKVDTEFNNRRIVINEVPFIHSVARDVTERKRAEEALKHSHEFRDKVMQNATNSIFAVDLEGRFTLANEQASRITGYSLGELIGMAFHGLFSPSVLPRVLEQFKQLVTEGITISQYETYLIRKDGTTITINISTAPLLENGIIVGVVGTAEDITERKRGEEALRSAENKYRSIFENAIEGIFQSTPEGRYLSVNPALARMHGYESPEEMMSSITDMAQQLCVDPNQHAQLKRLLEEQAYVKNMEIQTRRKDGTRIMTSINARIVRDASGAVFCYEGSIEDITERKRTEEELQKLYRAVEQSPNSIVITDNQGNIEYVNPKFTELTGYSSAEVLGRNPRILKSGELPMEKYKELWKTITSGHDWRGEFHNRKKNGELYWEYATISPIKNAQGVITHFLAIKEDRSVRKSLEEQLRQAQKMEAIGRLAGGVAHDFNNLLTAILGYSEMMEAKLKPDDPLRSHVREIFHAGERAATLVRQLLAFSRKQVIQPKVLNLNQVIGELDKMLRRLIGEDIDLVTRLDPRVGHIKADVGQIEQVVVNLAVNSRDAMPQGGKLTIETINARLGENHTGDPEDVQSSPYVMLSVSDNGCGMDSEVCSRIFEPFFTTKEAGKGTGLGLSTVYGIVNQNGGSISVYSKPGKGTTFRIYFPHVNEPVEPAIPYPKGEEASRGIETILIVEDDVLVRKLAVETLSKCGYHVLEATHGEEALRICRTHEGTIHLLLTDAIMPGMTGSELVSRIEPLIKRIKVLYMSGYTDDVILRQGRLDPEMKFLQKPFTPSILLQKVREVLNRELSLIRT
jgi:two-component system, cell cycle sensor histidine kinase and response regulator CckA